MRFFYADALDLVDPHFDFTNEKSKPGRVVQRDDVYAHELMWPKKPYDGLLVSKFLFDLDGGQGRYSQSQRMRFLRTGVRQFLRYPPLKMTLNYARKHPHSTSLAENFPILGDCGAFNYRNEPEPPYSVDEVIEFYDTCGFSHGVSVDHMIGAYKPEYDDPGLFADPVPPEMQARYDLTLALASDFLSAYRRGKYEFQPVGIAQGWSPKSYASAVHQLTRMGYDYVALGGLVPLKTKDILEVLRAVRDVTQGDLKLHLFGITRLENFDAYADAGVVSLDSASPMLQAFKDARNNYYSSKGHYTAIRIPQAHKYPKLLRVIRSGAVSQEEARRRERDCREAVVGVGEGTTSPEEALSHLKGYEALYGGSSKWPLVERTLRERPWEQCDCTVCRALGVDVIVFRGANRNRRRGFHNLYYTQQVLGRHRSRLEEQP